MDRHQEISSQLGLDEEDDEEFLTPSKQPLSEENLWRKFNDTDFDDEEL
jgi:ribosome assembly protein YihI (activator of Der GTPase)